jgi:MATE family multidrug resistance protein
MKESNEHQNASIDAAPMPVTPKVFARLSALNVLSTITVPLAGLVDTAMLGHLPSEVSLAGVALGAIFFDYVFWSFGFLRMATTGLAAGAIGREQHDQLRALLWRATSLGFLIGAGLLSLIPLIGLLAPLLFEQMPEVRAEAVGYVQARLIGAPASLANFALAGWLIGTGRSGRALILALLQNLGNIAFNFVFIVVLKYGATGAGLGTACAQWLSVLLIGSSLIPAALPRPVLTQIFDRSETRSLFQIGGDLTIRTICLVTAFSAFTAAGALFGATMLAAQAVLLRILGLFSYVVDGLAYAVETLAGQSVARRRTNDARRVVRWGMISAVLMSTLLGGAALGWSGPLLSLLTDIAPVIALATRWIPACVACAMVGSIAYILDGLFIGTSASAELRAAMLWSLCLGFLPCFGLGLALSSMGLLWGSLLTFMIARVLTLLHRRSAALPASP